MSLTRREIALAVLLKSMEQPHAGPDMLVQDAVSVTDMLLKELARPTPRDLFEDVDPDKQAPPSGRLRPSYPR